MNYWVFKGGNEYIARDQETNHYAIRENNFDDLMGKLFRKVLDQGDFKEINIFPDHGLKPDERSYIEKVVQMYNSAIKL